MKQKKKISFLFGMVLIASMLVAVGGAPAISNAVTSASNQTSVTALNTQLIQMLMEMIRQLQTQLQQLMAVKNNPTIPPSSAIIQCGWCGNSCINRASTSMANVYCADVMPSTGSYCLNIDGKCQITTDSTTVTTTTVPNTTTTLMACISEGDSISVTPIGFTQNCCSGLTLCPPPANILGSRGTCQKTCIASVPTVFISGSTYLSINQTSQYIANITGGAYPYSFVWSTDGLVSSYSDSNVGNYKWTQSGLHTINVKVTDSKGVTGTGNLTITINPTSTITCTDTDGGDAMYQKGTITIKTAAGGQWIYTDYCQGSNMVQEYNCLANPNPTNYPDSNAMSAYMLSYHTCGVGETCYDGACKIMGAYIQSPCSGYGDVDLDGYITSSDTEIVANYPIMLTRLTSEQQRRANVNLDGVVNSLDASLISQYISKSISTFPICPNVKGIGTHIFEINLGYGMENEDVKELQSLLAQKGYFSGVVSGYFGWQTEEAVKALQTANNLSVTGFVGPLTRELLNS